MFLKKLVLETFYFDISGCNRHQTTAFKQYDYIN